MRNEIHQLRYLLPWCAIIVWQARATSVERNPQLYEAFIAAQSDAVDWIRDPANDSALLALASDRIDMGIELPGADRLVKAMVDDIAERLAVEFDERAVAGYSDFMMRWGLIDTPIEAESVTYKNVPRVN